MITIAFFWYVLGWIFMSYIALTEKVLQLKDAAACFILTPLLLIIFPFAIFDMHKDLIIWKEAK